MIWMAVCYQPPDFLENPDSTHVQLDISNVINFESYHLTSLATAIVSHCCVCLCAEFHSVLLLYS